MAIDVRGKTHDLRITDNLVRETRGPARRVGLKIGPGAREITATSNRFEGFSTEVSDLRNVSG